MFCLAPRVQQALATPQALGTSAESMCACSEQTKSGSNGCSQPLVAHSMPGAERPAETRATISLSEPWTKSCLMDQVQRHFEAHFSDTCYWLTWFSRKILAIPSISLPACRRMSVDLDSTFWWRAPPEPSCFSLAMKSKAASALLSLLHGNSTF